MFERALFQLKMRLRCAGTCDESRAVCGNEKQKSHVSPINICPEDSGKLVAILGVGIMRYGHIKRRGMDTGR